MLVATLGIYTRLAQFNEIRDTIFFSIIALSSNDESPNQSITTTQPALSEAVSGQESDFSKVHKTIPEPGDVVAKSMLHRTG